MQPSPFDFVGALVAEESCPLCKELHAAVDECFCTSCLTHVCRDCSSLQPDTTWICRSCEALLPPRAYPVAVRSTHARLQRARRAAREHVGLLAHELAPRLQRARAIVTVRWLSLLAWLHVFRQQQRPRAQAFARSARLRAQLAVQRMQRDGRRARLQLVQHTRATVKFVRTWPLRAHFTSVLIATLILIAVARADNGAAD